MATYVKIILQRVNLQREYIYIYVNIPKEHAKGKVNKNLQDTDKIKTKMTGSGIHYRPLRSSSSEIPRLCEEVGRKHMLI